MKGLNKKLSELSILCGIDACAIVYSPYELQPEVWPNSMGVQKVLTRFLRMPISDQTKNMVNLESHISGRIMKAEEELKKQIKETRKLEMTALMFQCLNGKVSLASLSVADTNDLGLLVDHSLSEINSRIEMLKKEAPAEPSPIVRCSNLTDHMIEREGHGNDQLSLEEQHVVGILETMDLMQSPKSFMDLLMGSE